MLTGNNLKNQLKYLKKDNKTIDDYLQGLTTHFDKIVLREKPLDHEDQIEYIIDRLRQAYKSVIDQIESRDTPPTITEIHELNHEVDIPWILPVFSNVYRCFRNYLLCFRVFLEYLQVQKCFGDIW